MPARRRFQWAIGMLMHNQHSVNIRHNVNTASSHTIPAARSWAMGRSMGVPLSSPAEMENQFLGLFAIF